VQQEAAHELGGGKGHDFPYTLMGIILIGKADGLTVVLNDTRIGYGDAVGVGAEILDQGLGRSERLFYINGPFFRVEGSDEILERLLVGDIGQRAVKGNISRFHRLDKEVDEFSAEEFSNDGNGKEEGIWAGFPTLCTLIVAASRHDAVGMGMVGKRLSPGMQHGADDDKDVEVYFSILAACRVWRLGKEVAKEVEAPPEVGPKDSSPLGASGGADLDIHGSSGEIDVTEEFLYDQKRFSAFEQMGGETMSQHVSGDMGGDTGALSGCADYPGGCGAGQRRTC
jgi:hypothetical protein